MPLKEGQATLLDTAYETGGTVSTYGTIAGNIDKPKAARAVGTAIGSNPVAFLIPCHRVIQASGNVGGYRWGKTRKSAVLGWEAAKVSY